MEIKHRSSSVIKREVKSKAIFNGSVTLWDDVFQSFNIKTDSTKKALKKLESNMTWFGLSQDLPMLSDYLLLSSIMEVANNSIDEAFAFIQIARGLTTKKGVDSKTPNRASEIAKIGVTAYSIVKNNSKYNFFNELNNEDKKICKKVVLEFFAYDGYTSLKDIGLEPSLKDIIIWCWELNANRENKFIDILQKFKSDGITLDNPDDIVQSLKLNSLLKKQTLYIKDNWIDFDKVSVPKIRFGLDVSVASAPEHVKLSELTSVMHFKKMIDDLSSNNSFLFWQSSTDNKKSNNFIDYTKYKNLDEIINGLNVPNWGLKFAINVCEHNLSKNDCSLNKKELYNELLVTANKNLLAVELSNDSTKIKKSIKI